MSQTARDTIERALGMLNVKIAGVAPTAVQASDGLNRLNGMIHAWKAQGVDVGHVDLALSDNLALDESHHLGTTALLAAFLSGDYEVEPPASVVSMAASGWAGLQAAYITFDPDHDMIVERALRTPGFLNRGGWYTG